MCDLLMHIFLPRKRRSWSWWRMCGEGKLRICSPRLLSCRRRTKASSPTCPSKTPSVRRTCRDTRVRTRAKPTCTYKVGWQTPGGSFAKFLFYIRDEITLWFSLISLQTFDHILSTFSRTFSQFIDIQLIKKILST